MPCTWPSFFALSLVLSFAAACSEDVQPVKREVVPDPVQPDHETMCADDAACSDALVCNGAERCVDGGCVDGVPLECPHETTCGESGGVASCTYEAPSPWLLYIGDDLKLFDAETEEGFNDAELRLFGVPAHLMGMISPIDLSQDAVREKDYGVDQLRWAPGGSLVAFVTAQDLNWFVENTPMRVHWLRFGAGVPAAPRPVDGLPERSELRLQDIAPDDGALLTAAPGRLYLSRFDGDSSSTETLLELAEGDFLSEATFCGDGRHALVRVSHDDDSESVQIVALEGSTARRALGPFVGLSPDKESVFEVRDGQVHISRCATSTDSVSIPLTLAAGASTVGSGAWSFDSKLVAYLEQTETETLLVIASREGEVLWDKAAIDGFSWSPGAPTLVFAAGAEVTTWGALRVENGEVLERAVPLDVPAIFGSMTWLDEHRFVFDVTIDETREMWLADLRLDTAARHVATQADGLWSVLLDEAASRLLYVKRGAARDELLALDVGVPGAEPRPFWDAPGATRLGLEALTPDERHVLVSMNIVTDREYSQLWRVPLGKEDGAPVKLNDGRMFGFAAGHVFQPAAAAQRDERAR